ncbi:MAG: hypothetical protein AAGA54_09080 [Myxococcota bacterium]
MRRSLYLITLLALTGCFDDGITQGLPCDNSLQCGEGQSCGPGDIEDGQSVAASVCGDPDEEGWAACDGDGLVGCGDGISTALICRDGFETPVDCNAECATRTDGRIQGACGDRIPDLDTACGCAYAIVEAEDPALDCFERDGQHLVRSTSFDGDGASAYLQTCDEWCETQTGRPYEGSICTNTFEDSLFGSAAAVAASLSGQLQATPTCLCVVPGVAECDEEAGPTQCTEARRSSAVSVCLGAAPRTIECSGECGEVAVVAMQSVAWCQ